VNPVSAFTLRRTKSKRCEAKLLERGGKQSRFFPIVAKLIFRPACGDKRKARSAIPSPMRRCHPVHGVKHRLPKQVPFTRILTPRARAGHPAPKTPQCPRTPLTAFSRAVGSVPDNCRSWPITEHAEYLGGCPFIDVKPRKNHMLAIEGFPFLDAGTDILRQQQISRSQSIRVEFA